MQPFSNLSQKRCKDGGSSKHAYSSFSSTFVNPKKSARMKEESNELWTKVLEKRSKHALNPEAPLPTSYTIHTSATSIVPVNTSFSSSPSHLLRPTAPGTYDNASSPSSFTNDLRATASGTALGGPSAGSRTAKYLQRLQQLRCGPPSVPCASATTATTPRGAGSVRDGLGVGGIWHREGQSAVLTSTSTATTTSTSRSGCSGGGGGNSGHHRHRLHAAYERGPPAVDIFHDSISVIRPLTSRDPEEVRALFRDSNDYWVHADYGLHHRPKSAGASLSHRSSSSSSSSRIRDRGHTQVQELTHVTTSDSRGWYPSAPSGTKSASSSCSLSAKVVKEPLLKSNDIPTPSVTEVNYVLPLSPLPTVFNEVRKVHCAKVIDGQTPIKTSTRITTTTTTTAATTGSTNSSRSSSSSTTSSSDNNHSEATQDNSKKRRRKKRRKRGKEGDSEIHEYSVCSYQVPESRTMMRSASAPPQSTSRTISATMKREVRKKKTIITTTTTAAADGRELTTETEEGGEKQSFPSSLERDMVDDAEQDGVSSHPTGEDAVLDEGEFLRLTQWLQKMRKIMSKNHEHQERNMEGETPTRHSDSSTPTSNRDEQRSNRVYTTKNKSWAKHSPTSCKGHDGVDIGSGALPFSTGTTTDLSFTTTSSGSGREPHILSTRETSVTVHTPTTTTVKTKEDLEVVDVRSARERSPSLPHNNYEDEDEDYLSHMKPPPPRCRNPSLPTTSMLMNDLDDMPSASGVQGVSAGSVVGPESEQQFPIQTHLPKSNETKSTALCWLVEILLVQHKKTKEEKEEVDVAEMSKEINPPIGTDSQLLLLQTLRVSPPSEISSERRDTDGNELLQGIQERDFHSLQYLIVTTFLKELARASSVDSISSEVLVRGIFFLNESYQEFQMVSPESMKHLHEYRHFRVILDKKRSKKNSLVRSRFLSSSPSSVRAMKQQPESNGKPQAAGQPRKEEGPYPGGVKEVASQSSEEHISPIILPSAAPPTFPLSSSSFCVSESVMANETSGERSAAVVSPVVVMPEDGRLSPFKPALCRRSPSQPCADRHCGFSDTPPGRKIVDSHCGETEVMESNGQVGEHVQSTDPLVEKRTSSPALVVALAPTAAVAAAGTAVGALTPTQEQWLRLYTPLEDPSHQHRLDDLPNRGASTSNPNGAGHSNERCCGCKCHQKHGKEEVSLQGNVHSSTTKKPERNPMEDGKVEGRNLHGYPAYSFISQGGRIVTNNVSSTVAEGSAGGSGAGYHLALPLQWGSPAPLGAPPQQSDSAISGAREKEERKMSILMEVALAHPHPTYCPPQRLRIVSRADSLEFKVNTSSDSSAFLRGENVWVSNIQPQNSNNTFFTMTGEGNEPLPGNTTGAFLPSSSPPPPPVPAASASASPITLCGNSIGQATSEAGDPLGSTPSLCSPSSHYQQRGAGAGALGSYFPLSGSPETVGNRVGITKSNSVSSTSSSTGIVLRSPNVPYGSRFTGAGPAAHQGLFPSPPHEGNTAELSSHTTSPLVQKGKPDTTNEAWIPITQIFPLCGAPAFGLTSQPPSSDLLGEGKKEEKGMKKEVGAASDSIAPHYLSTLLVKIPGSLWSHHILSSCSTIAHCFLMDLQVLLKSQDTDCLSNLFLRATPSELWIQGTYWHDGRRDEASLQQLVNNTPSAFPRLRQLYDVLNGHASILSVPSPSVFPLEEIQQRDEALSTFPRETRKGGEGRSTGNEVARPFGQAERESQKMSQADKGGREHLEMMPPFCSSPSLSAPFFSAAALTDEGTFPLCMTSYPSYDPMKAASFHVVHPHHSMSSLLNNSMTTRSVKERKGSSKDDDCLETHRMRREISGPADAPTSLPSPMVDGESQSPRICQRVSIPMIHPYMSVIPSSTSSPFASPIQTQKERNGSVRGEEMGKNELKAEKDNSEKELPQTPSPIVREINSEQNREEIRKEIEKGEKMSESRERDDHPDCTALSKDTETSTDSSTRKNENTLDPSSSPYSQVALKEGVSLNDVLSINHPPPPTLSSNEEDEKERELSSDEPVEKTDISPPPLCSPGLLKAETVASAPRESSTSDKIEVTDGPNYFPLPPNSMGNQTTLLISELAVNELTREQKLPSELPQKEPEATGETVTGYQNFDKEARKGKEKTGQEGIVHELHICQPSVLEKEAEEKDVSPMPNFPVSSLSSAPLGAPATPAPAAAPFSECQRVSPKELHHTPMSPCAPSSNPVFDLYLSSACQKDNEYERGKGTTVPIHALHTCGSPLSRQSHPPFTAPPSLLTIPSLSDRTSHRYRQRAAEKAYLEAYQHFMEASERRRMAEVSLQRDYASMMQLTLHRLAIEASEKRKNSLRDNTILRGEKGGKQETTAVSTTIPRPAAEGEAVASLWKEAIEMEAKAKERESLSRAALYSAEAEEEQLLIMEKKAYEVLWALMGEGGRAVESCHDEVDHEKTIPSAATNSMSSGWDGVHDGEDTDKKEREKEKDVEEMNMKEKQGTQRRVPPSAVEEPKNTDISVASVLVGREASESDEHRQEETTTRFHHVGTSPHLRAVLTKSIATSPLRSDVGSSYFGLGTSRVVEDDSHGMPRNEVMNVERVRATPMTEEHEAESSITRRMVEQDRQRKKDERGMGAKDVRDVGSTGDGILVQQEKVEKKEGKNTIPRTPVHDGDEEVLDAKSMEPLPWATPTLFSPQTDGATVLERMTPSPEGRENDASSGTPSHAHESRSSGEIAQGLEQQLEGKEETMKGTEDNKEKSVEEFPVRSPKQSSPISPQKTSTFDHLLSLELDNAQPEHLLNRSVECVECNPSEEEQKETFGRWEEEKREETDGERDRSEDGRWEEEKREEADGERDRSEDGRWEEEKREETDGERDRSEDGRWEEEKREETDGERDRSENGRWEEEKREETDGERDRSEDGRWEEEKREETDGERDRSENGRWEEEKREETDGERDRSEDGRWEEEKREETDGERDRREEGESAYIRANEHADERTGEVMPGLSSAQSLVSIGSSAVETADTTGAGGNGRSAEMQESYQALLLEQEEDHQQTRRVSARKTRKKKETRTSTSTETITTIIMKKRTRDERENEKESVEAEGAMHSPTASRDDSKKSENMKIGDFQDGEVLNMASTNNNDVEKKSVEEKSGESQGDEAHPLGISSKEEEKEKKEDIHDLENHKGPSNSDEVDSLTPSLVNLTSSVNMARAVVHLSFRGSHWSHAWATREADIRGAVVTDVLQCLESGAVVIEEVRCTSTREKLEVLLDLFVEKKSSGTIEKVLSQFGFTQLWSLYKEVRLKNVRQSNKIDK